MNAYKYACMHVRMWSYVCVNVNFIFRCPHSDALMAGIVFQSLGLWMLCIISLIYGPLSTNKPLDFVYVVSVEITSSNVSGNGTFYPRSLRARFAFCSNLSTRNT